MEEGEEHIDCLRHHATFLACIKLDLPNIKSTELKAYTLEKLDYHFNEFKRIESVGLCTMWIDNNREAHCTCEAKEK